MAGILIIIVVVALVVMLVLALLGLDHEKLTFNYAGRDFRLTDVDGNVVKAIMA